ncbi:hypothetical protein IFM89_004770 [Coptis chinensis]|uniref:Uncharacterized protein n=1 Tax=Coptis chinensis TaxID=261450 RepID=A0A835LQY1_9MAGN|nr:hypothetical protein IFM89_004770 [Coptis chinensis]
MEKISFQVVLTRILLLVFNFSGFTEKAAWEFAKDTGVAALLKATHRDWSPARIKSAMMTTSYVVDHNGKQLVDDSTSDLATVLHYGLGHVDPDGNGNVPREFGGCKR